jgi:hypothetical protein
MSINDIGRADAQPISPEVLEVAYQEIEQLQRTINEQAKQIDSLEHRLGNQAVTIKTQASTIARQEEVIGHAEEPLVVDMREVPAFKRYRVTRLTKEGARCEWTLGLRNYVVTLPVCVSEALMHLFSDTPQNPPICPKEPPLPTKTVNVSGEPVGVHPSPNVTIAGGE